MPALRSQSGSATPVNAPPPIGLPPGRAARAASFPHSSLIILHSPPAGQLHGARHPPRASASIFPPPSKCDVDCGKQIDFSIPVAIARPWHPFLHALVEETKTAWEAVLGICRGGKGPQGRASGRERVSAGEALLKTSNVATRRFNLWFVGCKVKYRLVSFTSQFISIRPCCGSRIRPSGLSRDKLPDPQRPPARPWRTFKD